MMGFIGSIKWNSICLFTTLILDNTDESTIEVNSIDDGDDENSDSQFHMI